jgi:hypothetical protein
MRKRWLLVLICLGELALLAAAFLGARGVGDSMADISLDLAPPPATPPEIIWTDRPDGGEIRVAMEAISSEFTGQREPPPSGAATRFARYYARAPKRNLPSLRILLPADTGLQIQRICVATWIPRVYRSGHPTPLPALAHIEPVPTVAKDDHSVSPGIRPWLELGDWRTFAALAAGLTVLWSLAIAGAAIAMWLWRRSADGDLPPRELAPFSTNEFLAFFLPPAALWLVWQACFYPAVMSPDSLYQWAQAKAMEIDDFHPAFHTLNIKFLTLFWKSPAVVAIAQILAMSGVLAWGFGLLRRAGVPRRIVVLGWLAAFLSLRNACMAIVLWKDVLYSAAVFAFTVILAHLLLDRRRIGLYRWWAFLGFSLALIPLYRHNGLLVLIGMLTLIPFFLPGRIRQIAVCAAVCLCVFFGVKKGVFRWAGVEPGLPFEIYSYAAGIAPLVDRDLPFSEDEYQFLGKIRTFGDRWAYSPVSAVSTIWPSPPDRFDEEFAQEHLAEFSGIYRALCGRYPLATIMHRLPGLDYLLIPWQRGDEEIETISLKITTPNTRGLAMEPLFPSGHKWLKSVVYRTLKKDLNWLFWRPSLNLYLTLFACLLLIWRTRDFRLLLLPAPVLINTLSICIGGISQNMRYHYPMLLMASFFACLAFLPRQKPRPPAGDS